MDAILNEITSGASALTITELVNKAFEHQQVYNFAKLRFSKLVYLKLFEGNRSLLELLEIYTFGQTSDFRKFQELHSTDSIPISLTLAAQEKLKELTLLRILKRSVSKLDNCVPYETLYRGLQDGSGSSNSTTMQIQVVESYLRRLIYKNLISGRLDSHGKLIKVLSINFNEDVYLYQQATGPNNDADSNYQKLIFYNSPTYFEKPGTIYEPYIKTIHQLIGSLSVFKYEKINQAYKVLEIHSDLDQLSFVNGKDQDNSLVSENENANLGPTQSSFGAIANSNSNETIQNDELEEGSAGSQKAGQLSSEELRNSKKRKQTE